MSDKRIDLECCCAGRCAFLVFEAWDVDKPSAEWFAEFYVRPGVGAFLWRARKAFALLIGRDVSLGDIGLDNHQIMRLRDFLNETYPLNVKES